MKERQASPFALLFPWLAPLVITFALVPGGVEIRLSKNGRPIKDGQVARLGKLIPEPFVQWIDAYHIFARPQPYPLAMQFWQQLAPLASKKLVLEASALAELTEGTPPQHFELTWELNCTTESIEGRYVGADHYLGMGWFHSGKHVWWLRNAPSNAIDAQLKNLSLSIGQAEFLLKQSIPYLQHYLPTRANFGLIADFSCQITTFTAQSGWLTLEFRCNYPQMLPTIQLPQQEIDMLLAERALIQFPRQALTPVLTQFLQEKSSVTLQGAAIPLFIREQLPIMHRYHQISDDIAAKIIQAYPIVSLATIKPTPSLSQSYESGVGKYIMVTTYQYQQQTLNMDTLLAAQRRKERFVRQHGIWFEWPYNSTGLINAIQSTLQERVLRLEEVMGFDTRQVALLEQPLTAHPLQLVGDTPFKRGKSLYRQLRFHGIPGGILGEPKGFRATFVDACEQLARENRQARILWLVPSNKKGSVTNALKLSSWISPYVTVASLVTLRDEPALLRQAWTLVIFQELDHLLESSFQARTLSRLTWQWALLSTSSEHALRPATSMAVLHLHEQYYEQFCARYLFDLEKSYSSPLATQSVPPSVHVQPAPVVSSKPAQSAAYVPTRPAPDLKPKAIPMRTHRPIELNQQKIVKLHQESEILQERLTIEDEEEQFPLPEISLEASLAITHSPVQLETSANRLADGKDRAAGVAAQQAIASAKVEQSSAPPVNERAQSASRRMKKPEKAPPERVELPPAPVPPAALRLNAAAIAKLRAEATQLQGRLDVDTDAEKLVTINALTEPFLVTEAAPTASVAGETPGPLPEVDEDWRVIYPKWGSEHWEILRLLYQGQGNQLKLVAQNAHRPLSQLIDEINEPVDEQLGDLLIDPDAQVLAPHLLTVAKNLLDWYSLSKR